MSIENVTVAGGGVLGSQIAFQSAFCGFNVKIWLRSESSKERAQPKLDRLKDIYLNTLETMKTNPSAYCRGFTDKKELSDDEIDQLKSQVCRAYENIEMTTSYHVASDDADLIIEAIAEDPQQKIEFYQELAKHLPEKTILVTNSSTLLPSAFAKYTGRPEKYLALHFANEIWRNNTAEVMGHPQTDQKCYDEVVQFACDINMVPLKLKKEQPGYILNSMLVPFLSAAEALYATDVADFETIDLTWKLATGAPAGPFAILDVVGLTTAYNIVMMNPEVNNPESIPAKIAAKLKEKIDAGKTGVNAGEGFYKYD
ncbi:MAG: 3-hydroxyacyl-CoA dehydrogenase [Methanosphaera sp.]|nr:3-hydroxyacyl-CoA dehydrogenase [Methanosphaera sp.]